MRRAESSDADILAANAVRTGDSLSARWRVETYTRTIHDAVEYRWGGAARGAWTDLAAPPGCGRLHPWPQARTAHNQHRTGKVSSHVRYCRNSRSALRCTIA